MKSRSRHNEARVERIVFEILNVLQSVFAIRTTVGVLRRVQENSILIIFSVAFESIIFFLKGMRVYLKTSANDACSHEISLHSQRRSGMATENIEWCIYRGPKPVISSRVVDAKKEAIFTIRVGFTNQG